MSDQIRCSFGLVVRPIRVSSCFHMSYELSNSGTLKHPVLGASVFNCKHFPFSSYVRRLAILAIGFLLRQASFLRKFFERFFTARV